MNRTAIVESPFFYFETCDAFEASRSALTFMRRDGLAISNTLRLHRNGFFIEDHGHELFMTGLTSTSPARRQGREGLQFAIAQTPPQPHFAGEHLVLWKHRPQMTRYPPSAITIAPVT
jgi:hypothetical protein